MKRADFLSQQNSSAPKMKTATVMEIVMMENVTVTMDGNLQIAQVINTIYEIYNEFVFKEKIISNLENVEFGCHRYLVFIIGLL